MNQDAINAAMELQQSVDKIKKSKAVGESYLQLGAYYEALGKRFLKIGQPILDEILGGKT